jgi:hypothetical protein
MDVERWDPLTAGASATLGILTDFTSALGGTFVNPFREVRQARLAGGDGGSASLAAAGAVGKGFASMASSVGKGALVGVPLALAEGLRNAPRLYGEEVRDHGKVKDWKSGGVVVAKVCIPRDQHYACTHAFAEFWNGVLRGDYGYRDEAAGWREERRYPWFRERRRQRVAESGDETWKR